MKKKRETMSNQPITFNRNIKLVIWEINNNNIIIIGMKLKVKI